MRILHGGRFIGQRLVFVFIRDAGSKCLLFLNCMMASKPLAVINVCLCVWAYNADCFYWVGRGRLGGAGNNYLHQ